MTTIELLSSKYIFKAINKICRFSELIKLVIFYCHIHLYKTPIKTLFQYRFKLFTGSSYLLHEKWTFSTYNFICTKFVYAINWKGYMLTTGVLSPIICR